MKRLFVRLVAAVAVAGLVIAGCTQAAPAPTPTKAPAAPTKPAEPTKAPVAPTKSAEPTKAPAAQPTAVPLKTVDFPQKGKTVTVLLGFAAGGSSDLGARLLAPMLEKDLGAPFQVANKPGANGQVAMTEVALAKPDGYLIAYAVLPNLISNYVQPELKAVYKRNSFEPVARTTADPIAVTVKADSPYKSLKDLVDAAKANPEKIKFGVGGVRGITHLAVLGIEGATGVKFATVIFDSGAQNTTAMLGGHIDASSTTSVEAQVLAKSGQARILGITDDQESKFMPGVKTLEAQGYKVNLVSTHGLVVPAGTPKEIVGILSAATKKALDTDEMNRKLAEIGVAPRYLDPAQLAALWAEDEVKLAKLIEQAGKSDSTAKP